MHNVHIYNLFSSHLHTYVPCKDVHLSSLTREDIGVTSIQDSHGGASEELTTCGTELNLQIMCKPMNLPSEVLQEVFIAG